MGQVIEIVRGKVFTFEEASAILPIIRRITKKASDEVQELITKLDSLVGGGIDDDVRKVESEINQVIDCWRGKLERSGVFPKGLWTVDFDTGGGYYCWKYPEESIESWQHLHSNSAVLLNNTCDASGCSPLATQSNGY